MGSSQQILIAEKAPAAGGNSATFIASDVSTQGTWVGVYGADGYWMESGFDPTNTTYQVIPAYVTLMSFSGAFGYDWNPFGTPPLSDVRALTKPDGVTTTRGATTFYNAWTLSLTLTAAKKVRLYMLDWDTGTRDVSVTITDRDTSGTLDTQRVSSTLPSASAYLNGVWLSWTMNGNIDITLSLNGGINATNSGIFFDA